MKRNAIGVEDAVLLDNKLWFILSDYKCLVSMDIGTKETKSYTIPSDGAYTQNRAYASIALVGRKIYLIPFYDNILFQYDVDLEEFAEVVLNNEIIGNKSPLFMGVGVYKDYLFVMGVFVPVILRVNTLNNHVDYITDWKQDIDCLVFDSKDAYFRKQSVVIGGKLYIPFCNANAVLEIDCNSMKTTIHSLGDEKQGYSGICFDGNSFWLSPRKNGSMKRWNLITSQVETIQIPGINELGNILTYTGIIYFDNKVVLLPMNKKKFQFVEVVNIVELEGVYQYVQDDGIKCIYYEKGNGKTTIIDRTLNIVTDIKIENVKIDLEKIAYENYNLIMEAEMVDIQAFVEFVQMRKK